MDISGTNNTAVPANFDMKRGKVMGTTKKYTANKKLLPDSTQGAVDFKKKITQGCWSPKENTLALAFRNCIFLYSDNLGK